MIELLTDIQDTIRETLSKYTIEDLTDWEVQSHIHALYTVEAVLADEIAIYPFMRQAKGLERLIHPVYA